MNARLRAAAPAAVVCALALTAAPAQVRTAFERLRQGTSRFERSADVARRALRGNAYADVIAEAAARVPPGAAYAVADEGGGGPEKNFVRCDLAPRTPIRLRGLGCGGFVPDRSFARVPEVAVVVGRDGGLSLARTADLLGALWSGLDGDDTEIPGWVDVPADGATVKGRVAIEGWCQEGRAPCEAIRVWLDGREMTAGRVERFPRPEVCAAIPGMGDCSRAGWRIALDPGESAAGSHCVAAALLSAGRHRRIGPWNFTVTP